MEIRTKHFKLKFEDGELVSSKPTLRTWLGAIYWILHPKELANIADVEMNDVINTIR